MKTLAVQDVAFVAWKLDRGLTVQLWPKDHRRPNRDLDAVLGSQPSGEAFTEPTKHSKLSGGDWRVIDALIDNPTLPVEEIAEETGLSPKTVRKHIEHLLREKLVYLQPRLGALADSGELVYHLSVTGTVALSDLRKVLVDALLLGETDAPPLKYLLCRAADLAEATDRTQAASRLPGVKSVEISLNRELFPATDFVHSLVREKILEWEQERLRTRPH